MPVEQIGWPVDWYGYSSITFAMRSTSVEPVFINFSDGKDFKKDVVIEPMPGIGVRGVILFEASLPKENNRAHGASPLGYKIWPNTLIVPPKVEQISVPHALPDRADAGNLLHVCAREGRFDRRHSSTGIL